MPERETNILVCFNRYNPENDFNVAWLLHDPLLLSDTVIDVAVAPSRRVDGKEYPTLPDDLSRFDLIIVPDAAGEGLKSGDMARLVEFVSKGGALFISLPRTDMGQPATELLAMAGMKFKGWMDQESPFAAVVTDEPAVRITGLSPGESAYLHSRSNRAMLLDAGDAMVITRISTNGAPDLLISSEANIAVSAGAMEHLLVQPQWLRNTDYYRYRADAGYLVLNAIRHLLGLPFITQPASDAQRKWGERLYAYAMGKFYVMAVVGEDAVAGILVADRKARQAAIAADGGEFVAAESHYRFAVETLAALVKQKIKARRFLYRGWHASLLYDDYRQGGLVGYAECADTDWLLHWMEQQLRWATENNSPRINDVCPSTWEIMHKYFPDRVKPFAEAHDAGLLETTGGHYTQAYLQILSEECNMRQLLYGRRALRKSLGVEPTVWVCADDHYDFHPQLPQLLVQFGYRYVVLRCKRWNGAPNYPWIGPGVLPLLPDDRIGWCGLDGSELDAVTSYEGFDPQALASPAEILKANNLSHRNLLLGCAIDATSDRPAEKEITILNGVAPVNGTFTTCEDFFNSTPEPERTLYFGPDELWGAFPQKWTGLGWLNFGFRRNREIENVLLAAERFNAIAYLQGAESFDSEMEVAWKSLLMTHDHLSFGPPKLPEPTFGGNMTNWYTTAGFYKEHIKHWPGLDLPVHSADSATACAERARERAQAVLDKSLQYIIQRSEAKASFVVFNSLSWARTEPVELNVKFAPGETRGLAVKEGERDVPCQVLDARKHEDGTLAAATILCLVDVPSLGFSTLQVVPAKELPAGSSLQEADAKRLENNFYVVELNENHGGVKRIFDKVSEAELLDCSQHFAGELFSPDSPVLSSCESQADIELIENGPVRSAVRVKSKAGAVEFSCIVRMYAQIPRIEFQYDVDYGDGGATFGPMNWASVDPGTAGLLAVFPLKRGDEVNIHQPFGVYPTRRSPNVTLDLVEVVDAKGRTVLAQDSTPLFWQQDGSVFFGLTQGEPHMRGSQRYRFSLSRLPADAPRWRALKQTVSFNTPLLPIACEVGRDERSQRASFAEVEAENVIMSGLYVQNDKLYLRVHEMGGEEVNSSLAISTGQRCWQKVTPEGQPLEAAGEPSNQIELDIKPWQILTLKGESADDVER